MKIDYKQLRSAMPPVFTEANTKLLFESPFWGELNLGVNFFESTQVPTAGVNVTAKGMNFYWNPTWIASLSEREAIGLMLHEDMHLNFEHFQRSRFGGYDLALSNIAQDMIINEIVTEHYARIADLPKGGVRLPKGENGDPKYEGDMIFETLYDWLLEQKEKHEENKKKDKDNKNGQDNDQGNGNGDKQSDPNQGGAGSGEPTKGKGNNKPESGSGGTPTLKEIFDNLEKTEGQYTDTHIEDEVPAEMKKQIVQDAIRGLKARGLGSSDIDSILGKLVKTKKDYLRAIRRSVSWVNGHKKARKRTKPSRRGIWGVSGNSKEGMHLNVVTDVSGSMHGYLEKVLSCVYQTGIQIRMIQCDTETADCGIIKDKKALQKMMIKKSGGTELQPAIDLVVKKYNNTNSVILTDGYCDTLDFTQHKGKVLIITCGKDVPIKGKLGNVRQIKLEE